MKNKLVSILIITALLAALLGAMVAPTAALAAGIAPQSCSKILTRFQGGLIQVVLW